MTDAIVSGPIPTWNSGTSMLLKLTLGCLAVTAATMVQGQTSAPAPARTLSVGGYYSSGDYGASYDTRIRYLPIRYQQRIQRWNLAVVAPYIEVEGLGNVLVNVGGVSRVRQAYELFDSRGLGDLLLSATYQFDPLFGSETFMDLGFEIKVPTADETKGLGSGEFDYNLRADFYRGLGRYTVFGAAGYRWRGDSSLYPGLEDTAYLELGLQRPLRSGFTAGLIYSYSEPPALYSYELHEVLPYVNWQIDEHWSIDGYGAWGFTEDSPDVALGIQISYRW